MTPRLEKALDDLYHCAVCWISGIRPKYQWYGTWVYARIGVVLSTVGVEDIWLYIDRLQNTVAQYIAARTIVDLCLAAQRKPVTAPIQEIDGASCSGYFRDKVRAGRSGGGGRRQGQKIRSQRKRKSRVGKVRIKGGD